ncbi:MAG: RnfABCDGE type electron transport complex subunit D [Prevotellaceae bacterium]|jgi:electron transport complex protein RnfD|nr:RnfABCDGE type electron transport complex subunit D [Prevotellaceae bacterium]
MEKKLVVSPSPHIHDSATTQGLMRDVIIALLPAFAVSVLFFGVNTLLVTLVSVGVCVGLEWLLQKYVLKVRPTVFDLSAALTGLLLAMNLPSGIPLYMVALGAAFAIGVAKISFGGLGSNLFNPAIAGRIFLLISFPVAMTSWDAPASLLFSADATSGATPLAIMAHGIADGHTPQEIMAEHGFSYFHMLFGQTGGSFGEVSALALLLGFAYLLIRKVITWHIPVTVFLTVAIFTGIFWLAAPATHPDPLFHLLSGGLLLGAIFMATDYVTSPMVKKGAVIYAVGIGILTCVIRYWGAFPEGISFAILIMNAVVPLINLYVKPKRFGKKING